MLQPGEDAIVGQRFAPLSPKRLSPPPEGVVHGEAIAQRSFEECSNGSRRGSRSSRVRTRSKGASRHGVEEEGRSRAAGSRCSFGRRACSPKVPLYSGIVTFGNLVFLSGVGAHFPGTIEEHTKHVLDELERNLVAAGSSMQKVLKVNVYLSDITNFARMNSVYAGRWGDIPPPVRRSPPRQLPGGDALVEIECIASI